MYKGTSSTFTHSMLWLIFGLAMGLFLSLLLCFPELQTFISPLSFGRLIPVHLNSMLYGWVGLTCIDILRHYFAFNPKTDKAFSIFTRMWSFVIISSLLHIMGGHSSGKIYLEFEGWSRFTYLALLSLLPCVLFYCSYRHWVEKVGSKKYLLLLIFLALGSAVTPFALFMATSAGMYPPINPDSGGPTGFDLMGSTLVALPLMLGLPTYLRYNKKLKPLLWPWILWGIHFATFIVFSHGDASHHEVTEVLAMFSLWLWIPILSVVYYKTPWNKYSKAWSITWGLWYMLLTITATVMFLPGYLESIKFTSALVAHAHLAMAAMCGSFCMLHYSAQEHLKEFFSQKKLVFFWNLGLCLLLLSFLLAFKQEISLENIHVRSSRMGLLHIRILAGVCLLSVPLRLLYRVLLSKKND